MRKLLLVSFCLLSSLASFAQKTDDDKEECESWKGLIFDIGANQYRNASPGPELTIGGSRSANIYYYFGIPLGCGKFSIAPGLGFGFDNYSFKDKSVRLTTSNDSLIITQNTGALISPGIENKKSKLSNNYLDIPLELRFTTGKTPGKTFRIAIGARFGVLFNSHTKVKYTMLSDGNTKKEKLHDDFALENFRYGLTGRIGFGYLNIFGYYGISDLFKNGPLKDAVPYVMGITLSPSFFFQF